MALCNYCIQLFGKLKKTLFAFQTLKLQCYVANLPKIDFTSSYNTHSKAINLAICTHRSSSFCAWCAKVSRTGQGPPIKYVGFLYFDTHLPPCPSAKFKQLFTSKFLTSFMDGPSQDDEQMSWLQMSIFQLIGRPKPFVSNIVCHSEHSGRKEQAQKNLPKTYFCCQLLRLLL